MRGFRIRPSATAPIGTSPCSPAARRLFTPPHEHQSRTKTGDLGPQKVRSVTGKRDMGMPPSVACIKLPIASPGATKKGPSHRPMERFSSDCCAKITKLPAVRQTRGGSRRPSLDLDRLAMENKRLNSKSQDVNCGPTGAKYAAVYHLSLFSSYEPETAVAW